MTQLASVSEPKFSAHIDHDGEELVLELVGTADVPARQHLGALLQTLCDQAKARGVKRVLVDIRKLGFMNSSCFKDLICWLDKVRADVRADVPDGACHYRVVFRSSANQHWQKRSLHALACFARELVTVEAI